MNRDWYEALDEFRDQPKWLIKNSDTIFETIEHDIQHPGRQEQALDAFLTLFPVMVRSEALKQWVGLLNHTVDQIIVLRKQKANTFPAQWLIGNRYLMRHMEFTENLRPPPAKRRRRVRINSRQLYEAYLILLMTLFCEFSQRLDSRHISQMIRFARAVNNPYLYAKSYQAIAVIYNEWQNYQQAQVFAALSYRCFQRTGNQFDQALSAYEISIAYRGNSNIEEADLWLVQARRFASSLPEAEVLEMIFSRDDTF